MRDSSVESKRIKDPTENPTDNYVSIMKTLFALLNLRIRVTRTQYMKVIQNPNMIPRSLTHKRTLWMTESSAMPTNYITFPKCIHEGPCLSCITSTMLGLHTTIEPLKDQFSTHEQIPEHIRKTCMERLFKYCLHNLGTHLLDASSFCVHPSTVDVVVRETGA